MTKLSDLMDPNDLAREIAAGYVRERRHPHDPGLRILNYSESTQYDKHWNDVTRQTRGLIVRDGEVLARPFDKFFNYGEHEAGSLDLDAEVYVTDKMDGSLGILYPGPQGWAIATRGSFESEQAIHATTVLRDRYLAEGWVPLDGVTYLFEIVYPENRIVLDYRGLDDLVLLGSRNIETGRIAPADAFFRWPGPKVSNFPQPSLRAALATEDRQNAEGLVVRYVDSGLMVKIKQEDYVRLHKLVTGLNARAVWEHLSTHRGTYGELLAAVPDEFHDWVTTTAEGFLDDYETLQGWAHVKYQQILDVLGPDNDFDIDRNQWGRDYRKAFAQEARKTEHPAYMFQMLDGRDISAAIWKDLKPKGETNSLMNRNEDIS